MTTVEGVQKRKPWDSAADGWNQHGSLIDTWLHEPTGLMLDAAGITDGRASGMRVLDVAAGAGGQTLAIAQRIGKTGLVLATDISQRFLELAAANAAAAGFNNVATQIADAQTLEVTDDRFDVAVSRLGLMFCIDPLAAIRAIAKALRLGGRMSALVFSGPANNPCIAILMSTARRHAGFAPSATAPAGSLLGLGDPDVLAGLLDAAGLKEVVVQPVSAPMQLPSTSHYLDFVRASASPVMQISAPLSNEMRQAAWHDMARQLDQFSGPQGWVGPNELLLCSDRVTGL